MRRASRMNVLTVVGNLSKNIELKFSQSGVAIATGSIAVKRSYAKDGQQDTDFLYFKALGKSGENMAQYFSKGSGIAITGSYQRDTWKDNEGNWKESNYILVNKWSFTSASKKQDQDQSNDYQDDFHAVDPNEDMIPF